MTDAELDDAVARLNEGILRHEHTDANEPQSDFLRGLRVDGNYPSNVLDLFHF